MSEITKGMNEELNVIEANNAVISDVFRAANVSSRNANLNANSQERHSATHSKLNSRLSYRPKSGLNDYISSQLIIVREKDTKDND